ncbi:MAG: DUF1223 domain-containing protein [Hyphomicrobiaceae bacterium]
MGYRYGILLHAIIISLGIATSPTNAQNAPSSSTFSAVVELFTSQGCSSCPPADRLLKTYVDREDVLALTFPVDYWDYLGWKDTFASPQYSKRQRDYANTRGDGAVYTPQAVINGSHHMNGADKERIDTTINASPIQKLSVPIKIRRDGQALTILTPALPDEVGKEKCTVWLAIVQKQGVVPVNRGENGGHNLTYYNIVRHLMPIGMWSGDANTFQVPETAVSTAGEANFAVLIQRGVSGPIIGAAWLGADNNQVSSKAQ